MGTASPAEGRTIVEPLFRLLRRLRQAAILVDGNGAVVALSAAAERLLGNGLALEADGLKATDRASQARLTDLIGQAIRPSALAVSLAPAIIHRHDRRPMMVQAVPLTGCGSRPAAVLILNDLDAPPPLAPELLAALFRLTRAEARLAARMVAGGDPVTLAADLGLSPETVRSQLKSIFCKTQTRRQADLVALLHCVARTAPDAGQGSEPARIVPPVLFDAARAASAGRGNAAGPGGRHPTPAPAQPIGPSQPP